MKIATVLISSIGTGAPDRERNSRTYRTANYTQGADSREPIVTPYVFDAISRMNPVEKLVLIGTAGSDWLALYRFLCESEGTEPEPSVCHTLMAYFEAPQKFNIPPEELLPHLEPVKSLLCRRYAEADIIILRYGIDESELNDNFTLLTRIANLVDDRDEIIFDITHSFRSLSLFELIAVNYIKEIKKKRVSIKKVTYGMLEISRELDGLSPVIDLKPLITTLDLMSAIDEFDRFGTTYALCQVVRELQAENAPVHLSDAAIRALMGLSENVSINQFADFAELVEACHGFVTNLADMEQTRPDLAMLAEKIFREIDRRFYAPVEAGDENLLRLRYANWHYDKKRYVISAVSVQETLLSIACHICGRNENDNYYRERYRTRLLSRPPYGSSNTVKTFCDIYNSIRHVRNQLAHPTRPDDLDDEVEELGRQFQRAISLYSGGGLFSNERTRAQLAAYLDAPGYGTR